MAGAHAEQAQGAWGGLADEQIQLFVELTYLALEGHDAAGHGVQRHPGRLLRIARAGGVRTEAGTHRGLASKRPGTRADLAPERLGSRDEQLAELVQRRGAPLHGAAARHAEHTDRLHDAAGLLGDGVDVAGEDLARRRLGIDRVALAAASAGCAGAAG